MKNLLINQIKRDYPYILTKPGTANAWLANEQTVVYTSKQMADPNQNLALLHEVAHAILGHKRYSSDIELVVKEAQAWQKAKELAKQYQVSCNENHIDECMDTYREWLITRSKCPTCQINTFQKSRETYRCYNCSQEWSVSKERFCRTYRLRAWK